MADKKKLILLFLILLIAAISLSPRFSFGLLFAKRSLDIRVEDMMLAAGLIFWLLYNLASGKSNFKVPPLFWQITAWLSFAIFSILVNLLFKKGNLELTFFYFLKEVEFFILYLFVFYLISAFNIPQKKLLKYWIFFTVINVMWLVYVFAFDIQWSIFYGPNSFIEPKGPFPSGGFFLILFIFFFNLFLFYWSKLNMPIGRKITFFVLSVLPIVGVVSSGSMASALGLAVSLLTSLFLFLLNRKTFTSFIKIIILGTVMMGIFFMVLSVVPVWKIVSLKKIAYEYQSGDPESRIGILKSYLEKIPNNPEVLLIGLGVFGEAHSQYTRVLLERGVIGLILFFWLIGSIVRISWRGFLEGDDVYKKGLCSGLISATFAMMAISIPNDAFMVVKVAQVYWFFAAMAMSAIVAKNGIKDIKGI